MKTGSAVLALCLAVLPLAEARADMPVPAKVQAVLFKKVLTFDKGLAGKDLKVLVVPGDDGQAGDVIGAFKAAGFDASGGGAGDIGSASDTTVIYVMPSAPGAVNEAAAGKHLLTITGDPSKVEGGSCSIGLGLKDDGKPQILINVKRSKQEGREFSLDLLKLAKLIQ
jgi:hypothetical protein